MHAIEANDGERSRGPLVVGALIMCKLELVVDIFIGPWSSGYEYQSVSTFVRGVVDAIDRLRIGDKGMKSKNKVHNGCVCVGKLACVL